MENASKALLIAGGVLIAMLVLTLGVYFSRDFAQDSSEIYSNIEDSDRTEFNQQFLNYKNLETLNIVDIATIINLAKDSNERKIVPTHVAVIANGISGLEVKAENTSAEQLEQFMINQVGTEFSCTEVNINESGYVYEIIIVKK